MFNQKYMDIRRNYVIGAVVVILVFGLIYYFGRSKSAGPAGTTITGNQVTSTVSNSTSTKQAKTPSTTKKASAGTTSHTPTAKIAPSAPAPLSYLNALKIYQASNYYIQFHPCMATPGTLTIKKGSKVMLDNRDSKTHVIGIQSARYTVGAYNFSIATLNTLGTNYVTCDGGGSAMIYVQP